MRRPTLEKCGYFGPAQNSPEQLRRELPADYHTDPLKYLPPRIVLSAAELQLADNYEKGNFSGGYITSQIAYFRRGPTAERHQQRRERFRELKAEVDRRGLRLPDAYVRLVESDDSVARLRHNAIWLQFPDELVPLPADPEYTLFLTFGEGQSCGYWHLLLAPYGGPIVTFSEHPFGKRNLFPMGREPDASSFKVYQCAESFSEWIVNYFAESIADDRHYEELLKKYSGG